MLLELMDFLSILARRHSCDNTGLWLRKTCVGWAGIVREGSEHVILEVLILETRTTVLHAHQQGSAGGGCLGSCLQLSLPHGPQWQSKGVFQINAFYRFKEKHGQTDNKVPDEAAFTVDLVSRGLHF